MLGRQWVLGKLETVRIFQIQKTQWRGHLKKKKKKKKLGILVVV